MDILEVDAQIFLGEVEGRIGPLTERETGLVMAAGKSPGTTPERVAREILQRRADTGPLSREP